MVLRYLRGGVNPPNTLRHNAKYYIGLRPPYENNILHCSAATLLIFSIIKNKGFSNKNPRTKSIMVQLINTKIITPKICMNIVFVFKYVAFLHKSIHKNGLKR